MTSTELAAVIRGIVPVLREYVAKAVAEVATRVAVTEAHLKTIGDVRDRVVAIETKAATAGPDADIADRFALLERRLLEAEVRAEAKAAETASALATVAELTKDIVALRERAAVLETRAPQPGPPGANGQDGLNGKDGADGVGFDDLVVVQENERTFVLRAVKEERVKDIGRVTFPVELYRGVFVSGRTFDRGDCVTWDGSEWHCNETTSEKPGTGSKAWTLKVKRGRDGKDGRDAPSLPVVSVGGRA